MLRPEPGYRLREDGPRGSGKSGDLQITDHLTALPVELTLGVLNLGEDGMRSLSKQRARRRQSYAAPVRLDQPLTDIALQFAELLRHRRGRQAKRFGCASHRAERGHRMQSLQALPM